MDNLWANVGGWFIFVAVLSALFVSISSKDIEGKDIAPICRNNGGVANVVTTVVFGVTADATVICKDGDVKSL